MERPRRSTRSVASYNESALFTQNQSSELDEEPITPRRNKKAKLEKKSKEFDWHDYVNEETLNQLNRSTFPVEKSEREELIELRNSWHYQFVVAWLNCVCDSYLTSVYYQIKPLWRNIKFDELLFLYDINIVLDDPNGENYSLEEDDDEEEEETNESKSKNLYLTIKLQLLRQLGHSKALEIEEFDSKVNEIFGSLLQDEVYEGKFSELSLTEQFKKIYHIIKLIELRNLIFKNYLSNYGYLFEYPEFLEDDENTIIVLPNYGTVIRKTQIIPEVKSEWFVPIKLRNCTVKYEQEDGRSTELVHLDYSQDIDAYLKQIQITYDVLTNDWESFIKYVTQNDDENIREFIDIKVSQLLYSAKLFAQREKQRSLAMLLTRRKRSSRLVAKEEETKKKEIGESWYEKIDEREAFLKHRNKSMARIGKKLKDILWNALWILYEQDYKTEKVRYRNVEEDPANPLGKADMEVISHGPNFNAAVITAKDVPFNEDQYTKFQELPHDLCVTRSDIEEANKLGLSMVGIEAPDSMNWIFQCSCQPEDQQPLIISNPESEDIDQTLFINRPIICCDQCHRWQHWDCQEQTTIDYLSQTSNAKESRALTQRDFGTVLLGQQHGNRRSRRQADSQNEDGNTMRPTDKRAQFGSCSVFICSWCLKKQEQELRNIFVPELKAIRIKQRKAQEDREKRKQIKLEKKRLQQLQKQREAELGMITENKSLQKSVPEIHLQPMTMQPPTLVNQPIVPLVNPVTQQFKSDSFQPQSLQASVSQQPVIIQQPLASQQPVLTQQPTMPQYQQQVYQQQVHHQPPAQQSGNHITVQNGYSSAQPNSTNSQFSNDPSRNQE